MEAKATAKYQRLGHRKVGQILDLVRGKRVGEAVPLLQHHARRGAKAVLKVVASAAANALVRNRKLDSDALIIRKAFVDKGPILKRFRPMSLGRGGRIRKRTSHITVVVAEATTKPTVGQ